MIAGLNNFSEAHWLILWIPLGGASAATFALWIYLLLHGGKPALDRWNISMEKDARRAAAHTLAESITGLQNKNKVEFHRGNLVVALDQLHRSQMRFNVRRRVIRRVESLFLVALLLVGSCWATHNLALGSHRYCGLLMLLAFLSFAFILSQWLPLILEANRRGEFPGKEG